MKVCVIEFYIHQSCSFPHLPSSRQSSSSPSPSFSYGQVSDRILQSLEDIVGPSNLSTSMAVREHHGKDESYHSPASAEAVLFPTEVKQVQEIARYTMS